MAYLKNGSPRNGKIHSKLSFKAPKSQKFSTLQKIIFGEDKLSKKDKLALKASKNGNFIPNVCYSLNKLGRWEALGSLENIVNSIADNDSDRGLPVTAIKCYNENWMKSCKRMVKVGTDGEMKSYKVKSKRGVPFISLVNRDSQVTEKKSKKRSMAEKLEDEPLIMYKLNEWNSDDSDYQKDLKKICGKKGKTVRKNKVLAFDDFLDYFDVESDEIDEEDMVDDDEMILPASKLTIADCFVLKAPKTRKRKYSDIDFDMIEEIQKIKVPSTPSAVNVSDELATMGDEFVATINIPCNSDINKGFFDFPSFVSSPEFHNTKYMYDLHWLKTDGMNKRCLFTIPKSDKHVITNFSSAVMLECIQIKRKNRYIRITINATHAFDMESLMSKKTHLPLVERIQEIITELYTISLNSILSFNIKPSMTILSPSLSTSAYPCGDFELLYSCQSTSNDVASLVEDFEIIPLNESCSFCYKSNKIDLTILQCGHIYCNECSTKSIKKQIRNSAVCLSCEICETPFDPLFILSSTPLLLLQHYLRFIKSHDNTVCPSCQSVLMIPKDKIKFGNVHCKKCHITFCADCKQSLHFPLTCNEMKIWTSKMLHEVWFTKNGHLQCYCDTMLSIPSNLEFNTELECPECSRKYSVMWDKPDNYTTYKWWNFNLSPKILPHSEDFSPNIITKRIKAICLEAYIKMSDPAVINKVSKKITKLGVIDVIEAKNLYIMTLHFIEHGYAWLYLNKKSKDNKKASMQKCLKQLRGIVSEFEHRNFQWNDVIGCEKLKQWKSLTNKIINIFM